MDCYSREIDPKKLDTQMLIEVETLMIVNAHLATCSLNW